MNQLNIVIIEGNACRNAEIKYSNNGTAICKMSVAVNRRYKSGEGFEKEVSFFDVDCFGEVAKLCGEKVRKGDVIRVTGRLKQNRWEHDGQKRSVVLVVAERVEFGSKPKGGDDQPSEPDAAPADDDIPF
ncbi:MAG: single-stranded DNA-binding protein [Treponema sp.]|jgi:single-strand DNA-binding protein|nr:single-stranded DNA-binding protein [Treponema sp.]